MLLDLCILESIRVALGGSYPAAYLYLQTAWLGAYPDIAAKPARTFVCTLHYLHIYGAEDIVAYVPPESRRDHSELYTRTLAATLPIFSADGRMPDDGPFTILRALAASNANAHDKHTDLSHTHTNRFVDQVHEHR